MRSTVPPVASMLTINVKAGVITNAGDVKPVARRDFLVFKEDIKSTLATVNDRQGKPLEIFSFYLADEYRMLDEGRAFGAAIDKLKPITVTTFTTDFQGNATFQLPNTDASYWIYGSTQRVGELFLYVVYGNHAEQENANLVFDNDNAAYCG